MRAIVSPSRHVARISTPGVHYDQVTAFLFAQVADDFQCGVCCQLDDLRMAAGRALSIKIAAHCLLLWEFVALHGAALTPSHIHLGPGDSEGVNASSLGRVRVLPHSVFPWVPDVF